MLSESELKTCFKSDENIEEKSKQISEELITKKYDVSSFVEVLGFALTSPIIEMRVNATKLLSSTLLKLPVDYLSEFQIKFIITFYCDRFKDHHNVFPAIIDGITALVQMANIPDGCITLLFIAFSQHMSCQSQVRSDREKIFKIFQIITEKNKKELISMGGDFLYTIINSIDGERDPRNLEFLFTFMPKFIEEFPLLHLAEEMFEVFACYFPIDFNPSKSDPSRITRDNLASLLCNCLVASEEFAAWVIPLALEKLDSDLLVAKLDSFELLNRSGKKFGPKSIEPHFEQIWNSLKTEIFPGSDSQEILSAGLKALRSLLENAYRENDISINYQTIILGTILPHLSDAHHRMFTPSRSIALVCVTCDPLFAADKILNALVLKLKSEDCDESQKTKILSTISQVLAICSAKNVLNEISIEILKELEIELIKIVKIEQNSLEILEVLLNCLVEAMVIFDVENRKLIYECLQKTLKYQSLSLERILKRLGKIFSTELKENLIKPLITEFPNLSLESKEHVYKNLKSLVDFPEFENDVLTLIIKHFLSNESTEEKMLALNAFKSLLDDQGKESKIVIDLYKNYKVLDTIYEYTKANNNIPLEVLEQIALVLNILIRKLPLTDQKIILDTYLPRLKLNLTSDLFLAKGILGFMHETISLDEHFDNILNDLTTLSLESDDEVLRKACHHLLCSLLNKIDENENSKTVVKKILEKLKNEIKNDNKKAVEVLSWIAKGLTVRGYSDAGEIIETLAELLDHPTLSKAACLGFEIISIEFPELHLPIIKFLFKQKFFHILLNKIGHHLLAFSENHLNAFIHVLKMTPHKILKLNLEKIGPILFKCLEVEKTATVEIALEINNNFLKEKDEYFRAHLGHLIPQYIKLTHYKDSMNVRIAALECIEVITKYPTFVLLPYKVDVVLALSIALDDKKRLVRNAAVSARNLWFLIGSPNGE